MDRESRLVDEIDGLKRSLKTEREWHIEAIQKADDLDKNLKVYIERCARLTIELEKAHISTAAKDAALEWIRASSAEESIKSHAAFGIFGVVQVFRAICAKAETALEA